MRTQLSNRLGFAVSWFVVAVVVVHALGVLMADARFVAGGLGVWGGDFRGGAWLAAGQILRGVSPYVAPVLLSRLPHALVTPPGLALAAVPLAHLPYGLAVAVWNLLDAAALLGALWLLEVRDLRMYLLAVFGAPFVSSLTAGQTEGVFALLIAVAWRWRGSSRSGWAVGALIALKLYAFPLVLWLVATKRFRAAAVALGSSMLLLFASWAVIGFHGLLQYPSLLAAASRVAEQTPGSKSIVTLALHLGATHSLATAAAFGFAAVMMVVVLWAAGASDAGWLTASLVVGLVASPILWEHYLVLLFVPLAISKPKAIGPWLLSAGYWLLYANAPDLAQVGLTLALTASIAAIASARPPTAWLRPRLAQT